MPGRGERGDDAVKGLRGTSAFGGDDGHFFAVHRMTGNGCVDEAAGNFWQAVNDGEITFGGFAHCKLGGKMAMCLVIFRNNETPAGVFIESMNDTGAFDAADAGEFRAVVEKGVDEGAAIATCAGMDDEAGGFVDHDEIVVFKKDGERDVLGHDIGGRSGGFGDGDDVAGGDGMAGFDGEGI